MSEADPLASADPLAGALPPERVNYATGVLLDAQDFRDEQSYHRGRQAAALRALVGHGTLAGLAVSAPAPGDAEREVRVAAGLALDRFGRLVELTGAWCIRLARWFPVQPVDARRAAVQAGPPPTAIVDLFLSVSDCARGKTPAMATGPFDALDAVVPSRIAETASLELVLRAEAAPPLPQNFWPAPDEPAEARLAAVLGSWTVPAATGTDAALEPLQEHVEGHDPAAVFLARITLPLALPADPATPPQLDPLQPVAVDNRGRPFVYLPGRWLGAAPDAAPLVQP